MTINYLDELVKAKDYYEIKFNLDFLKRAEFLKYEDKQYHNEIENQFQDMLKYKIANDMEMRLHINYQTVLKELEKIDIKSVFEL